MLNFVKIQVEDPAALCGGRRKFLPQKNTEYFENSHVTLTQKLGERGCFSKASGR